MVTFPIGIGIDYAPIFLPSRRKVGGESFWGRSAPKPPLHKTYWCEV